MSKPTQIYIDDSRRVHVSYQCDSCSEWVHTADHCGYGEDYLCPDCFVPATSPEDKEHAMALDPHAVRGDTGWVDPNIPELSEELCATFLRESGFKVEKIEGFDLDDEHCRKMEARETLEEMYIHDWLIFLVDFDHWNNCGVYRIAIHKDVVNHSKASHADCSSPEPDEGITQYGPGTCATALDSIESLRHTSDDVYTLVDEGYIRSDNAHLIFKAQGGAS